MTLRKALLIDAANRQVTEVELAVLGDFQRLVGGPHGAVYIEPVSQRWLPGHVLLVDEEAHVRTLQPYGFRVYGGSEMLGGDVVRGNALVMCRAEDGEFAAPGITLAELAPMIRWVAI